MHLSDKRLLHDFYEILEFGHLPDGRCLAILDLNPLHPIFDGHFPGMPIVPGVCMVQITKELLEQALGRAARLISARNMKFLAVLNPHENKTIRIELFHQPGENGTISVECCLLEPAAGKVFFKMKATFV